MDVLKKTFEFEKRLVLLAMMFALGTFIFHHGYKIKSVGDATAVDKKIRTLAAESKIRPDKQWVPSARGSSESVEGLPTINAGAVIDFNTGNVFWSKNLKAKVAPASLAKLVVVMTALDLENQNKEIVVSQEAANLIPTKLGLKSGEILTLDEAVAAAILTSANDATEAIADSLGEEFGGGSQDFMKLVNMKLAKIGAYDSHFTNATGLDDAGSFSTVYDLAIIAHGAKTNYPLIAKTAASDYRRLDANANHKLFDLPNWNALLGTYPGVDGLKIGYTEAAGHVTIVTANRNGHELMAIIIGAKSLEDREIAAATLLNYGFNKYGIEAFPIDSLDLVKRYEDWHRQLSFVSS